jgi:hypothetical protein
VKAQTATRLAWSLGAVCVAATIGGIVLAGLNGQFHLREAAIAVALLSYPVVGALIAARQPHNLVGWVLCAAGLCSSLGLASDAYADYALVTAPGSLPGGVWVALAGTLWCAVLHAGGGAAAAAISDRPAAVAPLAGGRRVGRGVHGVGPGR